MRVYIRYALLALAIALSIASIIRASTDINQPTMPDLSALTPELTELTKELTQLRTQTKDLPTTESKIDLAITTAVNSAVFQSLVKSLTNHVVDTLVKKADSTELVDATLTHPSITSAQRPGSRDFTDEEKAKLGQCIKTALVEKKDRFPVIVTEQVGTTVKSRSEEIVKIWNEYSWFKTLTQSGFSQLVDRVKKVVGVRKIYEEITNEWATEVMTEVLELGGKDIITVTNDHVAADITGTTDKPDLRKRGPPSTEPTEPTEPSAIVIFITAIVLGPFLYSIPLLYYSMAVLSASVVFTVLGIFAVIGAPILIPLEIGFLLQYLLQYFGSLLSGLRSLAFN
ncbi:hypothetical protein HK102_009345 [Quaeritorhiza haematococci]|nr:hypothetical protein HK102_009345 [Quaeritorhiza haematococci]